MTVAQRARRVIAIAVVLDLACAAAFSLTQHVDFGNAVYWSVATGTTVGYGDVVPRDAVGRVIAVVVMLTVIPLFASVFALVTSGLTTTGVNAHHDEKHEETMRHVRHLVDTLTDGLPADPPSAPDAHP